MTLVEAYVCPKTQLQSWNFSHCELAPSIIGILTSFGIYKTRVDGSAVQVHRKYKRRRGNRAGRKNRQQRMIEYSSSCIPVITSAQECRKAGKKNIRERTLTYIPTVPNHDRMPPLTHFDLDVPNSCCDNSLPPTLNPQLLSARLKLSNFLLCNARSLTNKVDELEVLMRDLNAPLAMVTECWDITSSLGAIKGYKAFFNTRRDRELDRRGGGVGIYCREDVPSKVLSTPLDSCHEVLWLYCKPDLLPRTYSCLIVGSVYYPESARNRKELVGFLQHSVDEYRRKYSSPAFVIGGDFNLTDKQWLSRVLSLKQVVTTPTHESGSILDLILTNLSDYYLPPKSLGPLVKSDHNVLLWESKASLPKPRKLKKTFRPINADSVNAYGRWIGNFDFGAICEIRVIDQKVEELYSVLLSKFHEYFPSKTVYVSEDMIKRKCRLIAQGHTEDANKLRNKILSCIRAARKRYTREKISPLLTGESRKWHQAVKRLTGQCDSNEVKIVKNDGSLTNAQEVNQFFTTISNTHPTLVDSEIQELLADCPLDDIPEVTEYEVSKEIEKLRKNCASYPGELPVSLLREFAPFLAKPVASIINQCFREQKFPGAWKKAYVRVIPKVKTPQSCDQLRPISVTPNLAKVAETFIYRQLLSQVSPSMDVYQYGCIRGSSTAVYLVRLFHLILEWLDRGGVILDLLLVDFRKAFDLIKHLVAVTNLRTMGAMRHILLLVIDFLRNRRQCVYALYSSDVNSDWTELTCGAPQGTKLAALLFLAVINSVLSDFEERFKFVDDLSAILKYLIEGSTPLPQFSQTLLSEFKAQCERNSLEINQQKSKVVRFNLLKRDVSQPDTQFPVSKGATILGVIFSSDCSFRPHVEKIVQKGHYALLTLTSMRRLGFSVSDLRQAYVTNVRPILEYCCPVWGPQIQNTVYLTEEIEAVQKRAAKITLGPKYLTYEQALRDLRLPTLFDRRNELIMNFGRNLLASDKYRSILPPDAPSTSRTRRCNKLVPVKTRTNRFAHSFVPFFTDRYNKEV